MDTLIGTQIANRYQIISLLGEGGMGGVYKALDHVLQMEVALKVLHERLAQQGDFRRRFLQEARTAARLNHPGIVRVFDFGRTESLLYIVMELIPGGNLHAFMQNLRAKQQWIDPAEAIQLVRQIALALDNAHRQSILHRDLKPANIMMRPAVTGDLPYQPVITDLGLAKLAEDGMTTNPGVTMGTPAYMSPEQAAGETLDPRSDVYSLGILLYELVVGQLPFPIKSLSQAVRYHIHEAPPPPRSLRPDLPAAVEAMLLKALSKRPEQRYASADEFASALAALAIAPATIRPLPASKRGVGSISTEYQNSLVSPVERLSTPSNLTPDGGETLLQIRLPDGSTRQMPVRKERITVGRVDGNDLVLQDHQISREHLRIDFSAAQVTVTDLGSTNGAHLDQVKLSPHQPAPWRAESVLRVGNHRLRYHLPKAAGSRERTTAAPPAARGRGATPVTSPQMEIASTVAGMPAARPPRTLNWLVILLAAIALATIGGLALLFAANPGIIPPLNPENVAVATAMATASATTLPSNGRGSPAGSPENNGVNPGGIVVAETATPTGTATVTPTATPSATPTSTPTATSTPPPTASPTATHTALPPTDTPTAVPARPAETPTPTPRPPTSTPALPTHTPTPLPPTATATPLPRTDTPTPAPTPVRPGVLTDFENFGAWRRGDQAWGTFTQSGEQVREGRFAGKIDYNFPASAGTDSFVVFLQTLPTSGQPDHLSLWVYGNGSGHFLNSWIQDTAGQRWQFSFGQIKHIGWQQMQARLDPGQGWPNGKVMGDTGAKTITYPVQFLALVLDGVPDGVASSGAIYVDDLSAGASRSAAGGSVATATPLPRLLPAPTATSAPASGSYEALRSRLIGQMQRSSIRNDYSRQGTALVDALIGRLHDFQLPALGIGERTMVEALSREDAGDRLNAIVHAVMVDPGQSPFRQLIYRLIQGRQGVLTDSQQHALHSYFARAENPRVWQDNIAGVIGAVNRESFSWP